MAVLVPRPLLEALALLLATLTALRLTIRRRGWSRGTEASAPVRTVDSEAASAAAVAAQLRAAAQRTPRSLPRRSRPPPPPVPPPMFPLPIALDDAPPVRFAPRGAGSSRFAGAPQDADDRLRLHSGCRGVTKCGFVGPSGFDAEPFAAAARAACDVVVLTAIFGRKDKLQQPTPVPASLAGCYFAIVDEASATYLRRTAPPRLQREKAVGRDRIGAWRLLTLPPPAPYESARRTSRVPKLLPFRLFPRARYSVWVDGKLQLRADPRELLRAFLWRPAAQFAAPRNYRRDRIDDEFRWIRAALCGDARKVASCDAVEAQWSFYRAEQARRGAGWKDRTACVEGALLLVDLHAAAARCLMCAWFAEWDRFSERDQLAFAYTLAAVNTTPPARVNLWPREQHWHAKNSSRWRAWKYVKYAGHGGDGNAPPRAAGLGAGRGGPPARK